VLSSPSLLVIDNQTAQIKVGNQVPVLTGTSATDGGVVTESVQYRDTGVLLEVTPRINAGGLVTMEVSQEVTNVGEQIPPSNNVSFLQRSIVSNVAVQSGQTVVLGGLISDTIRDGKTGVPVLYELPILGNLFGNTTTSNERTELIVLITPRVVRDQEEARRVTEELRQKVRGVVVPLRTLERPVPGRT
jgi:general secretion pathway protein D